VKTPSGWFPCPLKPAQATRARPREREQPARTSQNEATLGCPPPSPGHNYRTTLHTQQWNRLRTLSCLGFQTGVAQMARRCLFATAATNCFYRTFCGRPIRPKSVTSISNSGTLLLAMIDRRRINSRIVRSTRFPQEIRESHRIPRRQTRSRRHAWIRLGLGFEAKTAMEAAVPAPFQGASPAMACRGRLSDGQDQKLRWARNSTSTVPMFPNW
jgi:hypothetical protein